MVRADGAELGVLLSDRVDGRRLVEELADEIRCERHKRDARVRRGDRRDLEEPGELGPARRRRADQHGRPCLDDQPAHGEREALRVVGRDGARARNLPGVDGGVLDPVGRGQEGEDAWITAWRFSFEHRKRGH